MLFQHLKRSSLFQLPYHQFSLCTQRVAKFVMAEYSDIYVPYEDLPHQGYHQPPNIHHLSPKGQSLQLKIGPFKKAGINPKSSKFEMAGQENRLNEYNTALAEVTRVIREQVRLIENNPSACIQYQRRIYHERWAFTEAWNVLIKIVVRNFQVEDQSATPNAGDTGRQAQRQITFLPFEGPEIWRKSSNAFREFIFSLPQVSQRSLGEEKVCNICYYPFFASRGKLEAEAICKGTVPPPDMNLQPHEVPFSDLPELPVRLPCGHVFGQICVIKWISGNGSGHSPKCPICRAILTPMGWSDMPPGEVTIEV